jgi:hypothetical protein
MGRKKLKINQRYQSLRARAQSLGAAEPGAPVLNRSRRSRPREIGGANLGCFVTLLVVGALGYGAYKFAPPYVSHYQLQDAMKEIATLSAVGMLPQAKASSGRSSGPVSDVQEAVLSKARELEIPLRKEDINVQREEATVFITVKYTVPIELPGRTYDYKFEFTVHN